MIDSFPPSFRSYFCSSPSKRVSLTPATTPERIAWMHPAASSAAPLDEADRNRDQNQRCDPQGHCDLLR